MKEVILIIFLGTYCCTLLCTVAQETKHSSRTILKELIRELKNAKRGISRAKSYGIYLLKRLNSAIKETSPSPEDGYRLIENATDRNDIIMNKECYMYDPEKRRYCSNVRYKAIQLLSTLE